MARRKLRISATDLDGYEYYLHALKFDGTPAMEMSDLISRLKRLDPETEAMRRGHLLHRYLETEGREAGEYFDFQCDVEMPRASAVEVPVTKRYDIDGIEVTLAGRCDAIRGHTVVDYKGSGRDPDYESYLTAWQWRAYLAMLPECTDFAYECFTVYNPYKGSTVWRVVRYTQIPLQRYDGLEKDVEGAVRGYVSLLLFLEEQGHIRLGPRGVLSGAQEEAAFEIDNGDLADRFRNWCKRGEQPVWEAFPDLLDRYDPRFKDERRKR